LPVTARFFRYTAALLTNQLSSPIVYLLVARAQLAPAAACCCLLLPSLASDSHSLKHAAQPRRVEALSAAFQIRVHILIAVLSPLHS